LENLRFILVISLALVGSMIWQAWEADYGPTPVPAPAAVIPDAANPGAAPPPPVPAATTAPSIDADAINGTMPTATEPPISVETDVLQLEISQRGAGIQRLALPGYPLQLSQPDTPLVILDATAPEAYVIQGGLVGSGGGPSHRDLFQAAAAEYRLGAGQQELVVPLHWQNGDLSVTKEYRFTRGSYVIEVRYLVENQSAAAWTGRSYTQIQRAKPATKGWHAINAYVGAVLSSPEKRYEKVKFDDLLKQKIARDVVNGWVAMLQHYFIAAILPADENLSYHYYSSVLADNQFAVGAFSPALEIAAGGSAEMGARLYVGPKIQRVLADAADGLELTVDYGVLWFIGKPLFRCLVWFHELTGNWGWSIILVTVLLKILFFQLSAAGYRSMANMRRVQPRLKAIQERYKEDRARLNQAMMQIYKEEKINPFGGCLPIVIQIPVFIALYWVLLESVEMRQAPFVLWIRDLSAPDPYWVLPLIMGATMFIQQRLNPAPMDPVQQKVMQIMPFAFTIFFGFFPSGLVVYWVANNILSIAQQWLITRNIERGAKAPG
jgi:YidC/Oxa1 family membrane protein insertase